LGGSFKLKFKEAIRPTPVINLSNRLIDLKEIELLSCGLKFIPKPKEISRDELNRDTEQFIRRLKLKYFFGDNQSNNDKKEKHFKFRSQWVPPDKYFSEPFLELVEELKTEIDNLELTQTEQNQNVDYRVIKSLKNKTDIVIKPADKGSSVVVLNRSDYIREANRQLSDTNHYKKIKQPIYPKAKLKIDMALIYLEELKVINEKELEYLRTPENPRERLFYLLPKIHKEKDKWLEPKIPPGRPIVSDCNSDTYRLSEYIDHFLCPLASLHPSYIRDTPDFLAKIRNLKLDKQSLLITIDVESLYTNINNKEGLKSVKEVFLNHPVQGRPDRQIQHFLKICLENNDFLFNNQWYLQISGTAMGKKFAPNYANIFMAKWEKEALEKCPKQPACYYRYLDDIFIIWPHSKAEFNEFFQILNSHHDSINLKATINENEVNFLDVTVFKGNKFKQEGTLDTRVYFKPTDSRQLLHKKSYHPRHTYKGLIKSQILRYKQICSTKSDFDKACTGLFQCLAPRGYSKRFLRQMKNECLLPPIMPHNSKKCLKANCLTCPHLIETTHLLDHKGRYIPLRHSLNCQSEHIIYVIQCKKCKIQYVGETTLTLHTRMTQHRSDINTNRDNQIGTHFNQSCPGIDNFSVIPVEQVPKEDHTSPNIDALERLANIYKNEVSLHAREQHWIHRLKTIMPFGLNKKNDLPPPIPFIFKYNDKAGKIVKIVDKKYMQLKQTCGLFRKTPLVKAYKRNKNLKDHLVHTKLGN
jgi:hypothetical protein